MLSNLARLSAEIHGPYGDGRGKERRTINEVIEGKDRLALLEGLTTTLITMDLVQDQPRKKGEPAYTAAEKAGKKALAAADISEGLVGILCTSELDPHWVLTAEPEEITAVAGLLSASRNVARRFQAIDVWANDRAMDYD